MKFLGIALHFMMAVFTEIWTGEVEKKFRAEHEGSHIMGVTDLSNMVASVGKAKAIHLVEQGIDPQVFIDGTSPFPVYDSPDGDVVLTLRRLDTENTRVTREELHGISYDKIGLTVETHTDVLSDKCHALFNYSFAPNDASNPNTPLIKTSGDERVTGGVASGKKMARMKDILDMKTLFDDLKIPKKGRRAVLCSKHINDLLSEDERFEKQWKDNREGKILRLFGFDIYEEIDMPEYLDTNYGTASPSEFKRIAFGGTSTQGNYECSFFYHPKRAWKAITPAEMFHSEAKENPKEREDLIGFRKYFAGGPKTARAYGALVSDRP